MKVTLIGDVQVMTANGAPITPVPSLTTDSLAVFTVGKVLLSSGGRDLNGVLDANKKMFSNSIQGIQMAGAGDAIDGKRFRIRWPVANGIHFGKLIGMQQAIMAILYSSHRTTRSKRSKNRICSRCWVIRQR